VDTDNLIEQKTQPLQTTIRELTFNNVQLQRSTRLLQQDLKEKTDRLNHFQTDQVLAMKTVGPEYEYLVQMINLLHRQVTKGERIHWLFHKIDRLH
jgi:CTP synthase (UTP-ammonia lyase)